MYVCTRTYVCIYVCMRNLPENMNEVEQRGTQSAYTPNQIRYVTALTHHSASLHSITSFPFSFAHIEGVRVRGNERGERERGGFATNGVIRVEHSVRTMQIRSPTVMCLRY
jgi:hypothetical protein